MMNVQSLRTCAQCGGLARVQQQGNQIYVECSECGMQTPSSSVITQNAIKLWNRRIELEANQATVVQDVQRHILEFINGAVEQIGAENAVSLAIGYLQSELGMTTPLSEVRKKLAARHTETET